MECSVVTIGSLGLVVSFVPAVSVVAGFILLSRSDSPMISGIRDEESR